VTAYNSPPARQLSLLSPRAHQEAGHYSFASQQPHLGMSADFLQTWKQRVVGFQNEVQRVTVCEQQSLFAPSPDLPLPDPEAIDPFTLPRQNTEFFRWFSHDPGIPALYFVIDFEWPLLLYVGETLAAKRRWQRTHDCKRYLLNYRQVHSQHQIPTTLGIGFWHEAPSQRQLRQQIEAQLIHRWRSPFNKENWQFWGTPFVGDSG